MTLRPLWDRIVQSIAPRPSALLSSAVAGQGGNPVVDWLDAAGLPWRMARGALETRYGVHSDNPYRNDLVSLDVCPSPLPGMLWPFNFHSYPRYSPALPPVTLSTHISIGEEAEANIKTAIEPLARRFGSKSISDVNSTRRVEWRWGAASVTLTVWPESMQSGPKGINPAHRRDRRLGTACLVMVQTGWRPPLSLRERAWLNGFLPKGSTENRTPARLRVALGEIIFAETQLEFMREPPADVARFRGAFGLSSDGEALIFCEDALYLIPLTQIVAFEVTRLLPAKGEGGSSLSARCETGYAAWPTKSVQVAQGERADDLNVIAADLAAAAGKPLELADYEDDS